MMTITMEERCASSDPKRSSLHRRSRAARVVTLTPAPAVDQVYFIDRVQHGEVNRARKIDTYLAGKGINVARSLHLAGNTVSAIVPVSKDDTGAWMQGKDLASVITPVEVKGRMRTNAILVDDNGITTNVNASPSPLTQQEWSRLCQTALSEIERLRADWLVLGGTLPINTETGEPVDARQLFKTARELGAAVCLDTAHAVTVGWDSDSQPDLIKPNAAELSNMAAVPVRTLADVERASNLLLERGIGRVLASLGSDGILEVGERGTWWARGPKVPVTNTTGAGDAALAGYLSLREDEAHANATREAALRRAVSWGALAVQQATTILPRIITNPRDVRVGVPDSVHKLS